MKASVEFEELFIVLTGKIGSAINKSVLRGFAEEGIDITTEQWSVLTCLWKQDKLTQQRLSELTAKDKPSITRLIDNLEKRNLVFRVTDPKDRRANLIHLTRNGEQLQQKATDVIQNIANKALVGVDNDNLEIGKELLKNIIKNLS